MNKLSISYILHTPIPNAIRYDINDKEWLCIHVSMIRLITPTILDNTLKSYLGISVPMDTIEAILAYPRDNNVEKDVTVVFTY